MTDTAEARKYLERIRAIYLAGGALQVDIERNDDKVIVGTCTLFAFHTASRRAEIGYALGQPYWYQGYMHEALQTLLGYAFEILDLNRLEADIDPRNAASAQTLERLGFQHVCTLRERWIMSNEVSDTAWHDLLRREWNTNTRTM